MAEQSVPPDRTVAEIAARQHGVASIHQLRAAGLSDDAVLGRTRTGRLHRVHRGVYAVGHSGISIHGTWMAAILACGADVAASDGRTVLSQWGAALSHRSAAELWGLLPRRDGPVHVSVPREGGRRRRKGIQVHRCRSFLPAAVTRHRGIPVTTSARTIADLRRTAVARGEHGLVSQRELRHAIRQADVLGLDTGPEVVPERTRSNLERRFLRLCRRHHLPKPEVNVLIDSLEVDFLWPDRRLVVETDGFKYHRGQIAFENDRDRDLRLRALGYDVVRLSRRQVVDDPERVAEVLASVLSPDVATYPSHGRISRHSAP